MVRPPHARWAAQRSNSAGSLGGGRRWSRGHGDLQGQGCQGAGDGRLTRKSSPSQGKTCPVQNDPERPPTPCSWCELESFFFLIFLFPRHPTMRSCSFSCEQERYGLSAEDIIVRGACDFGKRLDECLEGTEGMDIVMDSLQGPYFQPAFSRLSRGGRHVVFGAAHMTPPGKTSQCSNLAKSCSAPLSLGFGVQGLLSLLWSAHIILFDAKTSRGSLTHWLSRRRQDNAQIGLGSPGSGFSGPRSTRWISLRRTGA
jgi:hypothetical protein